VVPVINVYDLKESRQWSDLLNRFPGLDIFFQPDYCRLFEREGEGQARLFVYRSETGWAIYPFLMRRVNDLPCFQGKLSKDFYDTVSPYGFSGPVISAPDDPLLLKKFRDNFDDYCLENNIVAEFIRFHPLLENHRYAWEGLITVEKNKKIVIVDLSRSGGEIWQGYKYSNRKNIKKAQREGLETVIETGPDRFLDFYDIYQKTMERRQAQSYYYFSPRFFRDLHSQLEGNYAYAFTFKDKKAVSAELLLFQGPYLHSFLGGTLSEYFDCRPNNLLKHEVILWAQCRGFKYYLLGGGYRENDGIFQYKLSFAPEGLRDFYIGKKMHNPEAAVYLEEIMIREKGKRDQENHFFPPYRYSSS
jgi:lipid II:glycine glycyltransferase (peptidoglycan interpeptide bridge formation enzyme)